MNNPFDIPEERCAMCIPDFEGGWKCRGLEIGKNEECQGKLCSSYKTEAQCKAEKEKCRARIRSLPVETRNHIYKKYGMT